MSTTGLVNTYLSTHRKHYQSIAPNMDHLFCHHQTLRAYHDAAAAVGHGVAHAVPHWMTINFDCYHNLLILKIYTNPDYPWCYRL